MTGTNAALWGLLGACVAEALALSASMRPVGASRRWRWPWDNRTDLWIVLIAVALRLFVGCGLAAPLGASGQLPTEFSAFLAGLSAPLVIARLFQFVPVAEAVPPDVSDAVPIGHEAPSLGQAPTTPEPRMSDAAG